MRAETIQRLFPDEVVVESGDPAEVEGELHPLERELFGRAVEKRRRELAAGRVLARRALARLGVHGHALLRDGERAPLWPAGVVGSITHTRGLCAVAVARAARLAGLGFDLEHGRELPARLLQLVCTPRELRWIEARPAGERALLGKLVFSAKESVFKCQYPLARRWLGFQDVELELDPVRESFRARTGEGLAPLVPRGCALEGRIAVDDAFVASSALLHSGGAEE